jgi:hypothetical protein
MSHDRINLNTAYVQTNLKQKLMGTLSLNILKTHGHPNYFHRHRDRLLLSKTGHELSV